MPRPTGSRNADFEAKRTALVRRAGKAWLERGAGTSLQELAAAADVSVPTLKHYFRDRDGLFEAVVANLRQDGQRFIDDAAVPRGTNADAAIARFFDMLLSGWRHFGVGRIHALGIAEGLGDPTRGQAYVNHVLEPTLDACERLLAALVARGDLPKSLEPRGAALALAGPVVLALLHQDALGGASCRPLDVPGFAATHRARWLAGHAGPAKRGRPR